MTALSFVPTKQLATSLPSAMALLYHQSFVNYAAGQLASTFRITQPALATGHPWQVTVASLAPIPALLGEHRQ